MTISEILNKLSSLDVNKLNELYKYSSYIDHTLLRADATNEEIENLCNEAIAYKFKSVCVNPCKIKLCKEILKNTGVLVCTVVGFPLGQNSSLVKAYEALLACSDGADEIDMVINIDDLKNRRFKSIIDEVQQVKQACGGRILKVIVETCLLNDADKLFAIEVLSQTTADFIKTSTGFSTSGANISDIVLWKDWKNKNYSKILIKAAGGIKTGEDLKKFINAGADRIGTSKSILLIDDIFNLQKSNNSQNKNISIDIGVNEKTKKEKTHKKEISKSELKEDNSNESTNNDSDLKSIFKKYESKKKELNNKNNSKISLEKNNNDY